MNLGRPIINNQEFNNFEQNEEETFNYFGINQNQNGGNINEHNDEINMPGISQINNPITNDNQNKQDKENNSQNISNILTKSKHFQQEKKFLKCYVKQQLF